MEYYDYYTPEYYTPKPKTNYVIQKEPFIINKDDEKMFLYFLIFILVCVIIIINTNYQRAILEMAKEKPKEI